MPPGSGTRGAVVAGASVQAKNTETGLTYPVMTTDTGNYTVAQLPVGRYQITVNATGFKVRSRGMSRGALYTGDVLKIGEIYDIEELHRLGGAIDYVVGTPLSVRVSGGSCLFCENAAPGCGLSRSRIHFALWVCRFCTSDG